jgi:hypothetical protein
MGDKSEDNDREGNFEYAFYGAIRPRNATKQTPLRSRLE